MEHTLTNDTSNGSTSATDQNKSDYSFPTPAADQLEQEIGKPLSHDAYESIAEPYENTEIMIQGNRAIGYLATLGPYRLIHENTLAEVVKKLERPTTKEIIHLMNCMIEAYHNWVTKEQTNDKTKTENLAGEENAG